MVYVVAAVRHDILTHVPNHGTPESLSFVKQRAIWIRRANSMFVATTEDQLEKRSKRVYAIKDEKLCSCLLQVFGQPHLLEKRKGKYLRLRNIILRECLAEFLGVFVLLFITTAAVAQGVTSSETKGNFFCMYLAGAIAVVIAIYVSGGVSGGHLNPAYSLSLCVLGRFPWSKLPLYFVIQLLGHLRGPLQPLLFIMMPSNTKTLMVI
ncbi:unnamed protein product [Ranitomeya imitator]|uniref:Uncharacterized protein n=1 Tax=Ranitomeya imitator TaxID=111125 RepID=A0ABN9LGJ5_9NEOB|nr:unnamed protein product [Ranitomeya imitator]